MDAHHEYGSIFSPRVGLVQSNKPDRQTLVRCTPPSQDRKATTVSRDDTNDTFSTFPQSHLCTHSDTSLDTPQMIWHE